MRDMLYEAACWRPGTPRPPREEVLAAHEISHYIEAWGRPGDAAVVAVNATGGRAGAAWYRLMRPEDPGYGFVNAATPEVVIGVLPEYRGRGVGSALLDGLLRTARAQGFAALSLGVETGNPALRIYERHGFVKLFDRGGSRTMKADLSADPATASNRPLKLSVLDDSVAVCRMDAGAAVPLWPTAWSTSGGFFSVTRTVDELSVVCPERFIPDGVKCERGWRVLKLNGPFDFSEVGVLTSVVTPLAEAGIAVFVVSTYDTDYVLVKLEQLGPAVSMLCGRGHKVS